jgi:putative ABC transport system permease protein
LGLPFALAVGLLAGSYPAFFLSRFQPIRVLQGDFSRSKEGKGLRKTLVVGQFLCCGALLLFLFHVVQQVNYMNSKDLGFKGDQVIVVPLQKTESNNNFDAIRNQLLQHNGIESVSQVNRLPGEGMGGNNYVANGKDKMMDFNQVDENFLNAMQLELVQGQFFTKANQQDTFPQYVVNESFINAYGFEGDPIGQIMSRGGGYAQGPILGVVKDFHWKGFTQKIEPFVMQEYNAYIGKAAIRVKTEQLATILPFLQEKWATFEPGFPLRYTFLNEDFAVLYQQYINFGRMLTYLAVLILFTALLGLFGLAVFMAEQRTKEIGIRKVLGASVEQLTYLLVKDFSKLVLLGGVLAIPVGWWASNFWLEDFAYRINIQIWIFAAALILLLVVSLLTVSTQAIRAALSNPVESLKDE